MKQARGSDELLFMHRLTIAFFSCKNIWYIGYFAPKTLHRLLDYASYSKLLPVEHTVQYTNFLVTSSNNLFLIIQPVQQTKEIYFSVITPEWCYLIHVWVYWIELSVNRQRHFPMPNMWIVTLSIFMFYLFITLSANDLKEYWTKHSKLFAKILQFSAMLRNGQINSCWEQWLPFFLFSAQKKIIQVFM